MGVLTFPPRPAPDRPCPRLHVWRSSGSGDCRDGAEWELHHEGRNSDSWAFLGRYTTREEAVRAALDALPIYPGTLLGEIAQ